MRGEYRLTLASILQSSRSGQIWNLRVRRTRKANICENLRPDVRPESDTGSDCGYNCEHLSCLDRGFTSESTTNFLTKTLSYSLLQSEIGLLFILLRAI